MARMVEREFYYRRMPVNSNQLTDWQIPRSVISFYDEKGRYECSLDIGRLCFKRRVMKGRRAAFHTLPVDEMSLDESRIPDIAKCIDCVSLFLKNGTRNKTVYAIVSNFMEFIDWADSENLPNFLSDRDASHRVLNQYCEALTERCRQHGLKANSIAAKERNVADFLGTLFEDEAFSNGIRMMWTDPNATESTIPPGEDAQGRVLALYEALFWGFSELVLDKRDFPFALKAPSYLNLKNNTLWIFPTTRWCVCPHHEVERATWKFPCWAYDFENGHVVTPERMAFLHKEHNLSNRPYDFLYIAKRTISEANENKYNYQRIKFARLAMNTFAAIFTAKTAANWTPIISLQWSDDYEATTPRQKFRAIKWRAGGKEITFELPVQFMSLFKRFLELRKYLLNDAESDLMFFGLGTGSSCEPGRFGNNLTTVTEIFQRIDPHLPNITAMEWRAAKSDWLLRVSDVDTTAKSLQNTPAVVRKSYAEGSHHAHKEEISGVLNLLSSRVKEANSPPSPTSIVTGGCEKYGHPDQLDRPGGAKQECRPDEGCLFCSNHRVLADETDTRKLASCKFVLIKSAPMLGGIGGSEAELKPFIDRIDVLLGEISARDKNLVERITDEVENFGELTPFWERKLEMLTNLGIFDE